MTITANADTPQGLMNLFAQLAAAGRVDDLVELYESDAIFSPQPGIELRGTAQIREALAEFLVLKPQISYSGDAAVHLTGDVALVANDWTMTATAPDGTTVEDSGLSADVVRRQVNGTWKVLIDQPRGQAPQQ